MNFVYAFNDGFISQSATSILSLLENNQQAEEIVIHVISDALSNENKELLKSMVDNYGRQIIFYGMQPLATYFDFSFDTAYWPDIILARLLLDKFLPHDISRVVYLDGDTLVVDNIEELFSMDLEGNAFGASIEPTVPKGRKQKMGVAETTPYFNSGVLVIDFAKWIQEDIGKQIIAFYKRYDGLLDAPDQDAINGSMEGRIYPISPRYNFCHTHSFYKYNTMKKANDPAPYFTKKQYEHAKQYPAIVHLLGDDRPWRKGSHHKFKKHYERYLSMTPWRGTPKEEGYEVYLFFWHLMNVVTSPIPELRFHIINALTPSVEKNKRDHAAKMKKEE